MDSLMAADNKFKLMLEKFHNSYIYFLITAALNIL